MKWIKSSEKMPKPNDIVLATDGMGNYHIATYTEWFDKNDLIHYNCDFSCGVAASPYWVPLSEMPMDVE